MKQSVDRPGSRSGAAVSVGEMRDLSPQIIRARISGRWLLWRPHGIDSSQIL